MLLLLGCLKMVHLETFALGWYRVFSYFPEGCSLDGKSDYLRGLQQTIFFRKSWGLATVIPASFSMSLSSVFFRAIVVCHCLISSSYVIVSCHCPMFLSYVQGYYAMLLTNVALSLFCCPMLFSFLLSHVIVPFCCPMSWSYVIVPCQCPMSLSHVVVPCCCLMYCKVLLSHAIVPCLSPM